MSLTRFPCPNYDKPFHWWGYAWPPPVPTTLAALVACQMLTADVSAYLVDALNTGKSLAVVSDASGAGKSTLLWALADAARGDLQRIYIRGQFEPFAFARPVQANSTPTILMINEVSPHLPVYCWGSVRDRLFGPEFARVQKAATAHASSLESYCLNWNTWSGLAHHSSAQPFDIAVFLSSDDPGRAPFRVRDIQTFD